MLLAIDAGNTNVVFALMDGRAIKARWRIATDPRRTADEYAVWLHQLLALEGIDRSEVEAVIVATVEEKPFRKMSAPAAVVAAVRSGVHTSISSPVAPMPSRAESDTTAAHTDELPQ